MEEKNMTERKKSFIQPVDKCAFIFKD